MKEKRNFTPEFKGQVIKELLSGASRPAKICRRNNIGISLLYPWKKQYSLGKLNNEPIKEAALQNRVEQLERLVGKLTLENEFLKKALQNNVIHHSRKGNSSNNTSSKQLPEDASL